MTEFDVLLPDEGYLRLTSILKIFPVGKSTWWAGVKSGRFPKPVKLGANTTAWRARDIRMLIQKCDGELLTATFVERLKKKLDESEASKGQRVKLR